MTREMFDVTCDRCGGPGEGTIRTAGAAWLPGAYIVHTKRAFCDGYLAAKEAAEAAKRRLATQQPNTE